jgi:hypothetical protein
LLHNNHHFLYPLHCYHHQLFAITSEVTIATLERILSWWDFAHETLGELHVSSSSSFRKEFFILASFQQDEELLRSEDLQKSVRFSWFSFFEIIDFELEIPQ